MPRRTIDAVTWFKDDYTEDGSLFTQAGIQDELPQATASTPNAPSPFSSNDRRHPRETRWNQVVNYLHLRIDINAPNLFAVADARVRGKAWIGDISNTRQDLGPLHVKQSEILNRFTKRFKDVIYFEGDKHTFPELHFKIAQIPYCFTAEVVAGFCVKYRRQMMEAGEEGLGEYRKPSRRCLWLMRSGETS